MKICIHIYKHKNRRTNIHQKKLHSRILQELGKLAVINTDADLAVSSLAILSLANLCIKTGPKFAVSLHTIVYDLLFKLLEPIKTVENDRLFYKV